jgi:hypothetical protein
MKRVAFGFVWFIGLWIGTLVLGGGVAGMLALRTIPPAPAGFASGFDRGFVAGQAAGQDFGLRYGGVILLGALVISVGGTAMRLLPGTAARAPARATVQRLPRLDPRASRVPR